MRTRGDRNFGVILGQRCKVVEELERVVFSIGIVEREGELPFSFRHRCPGGATGSHGVPVRFFQVGQPGTQCRLLLEEILDQPLNGPELTPQLSDLR